MCIFCRLRPAPAAVWHNGIMLIYAGIDEAGYGPMLGPLCVGMSVFAIQDADPADGAPNLWERLEDVVCTGARDSKRRIAVADSKKLKGSNQAKAHPLRHLERGVLSFLSCREGRDSSEGHAPPADDASLFGEVGTSLPTTVSTPWYQSMTSLPVAHEPEGLALEAARLGRGLSAAGIRVLGLRGECIDAGEFNRFLASGTGKAAINMDAAIRLVAAIRSIATEFAPEEVPRIVCDRQGGRTRYREWLQDCFPEATIRILGETPATSRYRLEDPQGAFVISFETGSESKHLPVALASMTAKYLRELAMVRLNRFFTAHVPQIRPTAGYVQDGRRFLDEIRSVMETESLDSGELVRRS